MFYRVRQQCSTHCVADSDLVQRIGGGLRSAIRPGDDRVAGTVAILVGSRSIDRLAEVLTAVVATLISHGSAPFVVAAMGSHGGGTAGGQLAVLRELGVTEDRIGAPIRDGLTTVVVATTRDGVPVHVATAALDADAVIPINRIKPHTLFGGEYGSGLVKMLLMGLGGHAGARTYHDAALTFGFDHVVSTAIPCVLEACNVPCGLAVIEDAAGRAHRVEVVEGARLLAREPALLREASERMARLPLRAIDLLIVDEMGKHVSGQGMDPNVTGRLQGRTGTVDVGRLFVRELGAASHGNAHGIGQADATTSRLVRAANWETTWVNTLTTGYPDRGRIPAHFATDREAVEAMLAECQRDGPKRARIVRVANTRSLALLDVSESCLEAFEHPEAVTIEAGPFDLPFGLDGNLAPLRP